MTKPSPEIEAKAASAWPPTSSGRPDIPEPRPDHRLRRTSQTLGEAWAAFWRHPSPG